MRICYRINDSILYIPPKHWDINIINNLITVSLHNYNFIYAINVCSNIYIGYYYNDKYTIYYYNN